MPERCFSALKSSGRIHSAADLSSQISSSKTALSRLRNSWRSTRKQETTRVSPTAVMIVDGILTFCDERLREMFDVKIFADADADERILRRLRRDVTERGRDIDGVISQYLGTVKIMHRIYVEPTKKYADIIVNGGKNKTALDIVASRIERKLSEEDI